MGDCNQANKRLMDYLKWYNYQRVHKGLNYQMPFNFSLSFFNPKKSNLLCESTIE
ncbi:MAG: transposase [Endomicrobium sp.]|nr:transposase [Endomicrobium sp.]